MICSHRRWTLSLLFLAFILASIGLTGCGEEKSNSNTPPIVKPPAIPLPYISAIYPSKKMISETEEQGNISGFTLIGNYFTSDTVVLVDGKQMEYQFNQDGSISAKTYLAEAFYPGIHTVQIQTKRGNTNTVSYEIYRPARSPQIFDALETYFRDEVWIKHIGVGDFDGDGTGEIFAYDENPYPREIHIFKRMETGELKRVKKFDTSYYIFEHAMTGDVNGDGFCDVVLLRSQNTYGGLIVLTNDGQGNLQETSIQPNIFSTEKFLFEDINGDGRKDLLAYNQYSRGLSLLFNLEGAFSDPLRIVNRPDVNLSYQYSMPWSLATGDFNSDGKKDVLYSAYDVDRSTPDFRLLLQQNSGLFQEIPANLEGLPVPNDNITEIATTIDYNRDGFADIALQINDQTEGIRLNIYRNQGDTTFSLVSSRLITQPHNPSAYRFTVGDFDQDGNPDMAGIKDIGIWSENIGEHVIYYWGNGKGEFLSEKVRISQVASLATGDINGDGIEDVVTGHGDTTVSAILGSRTRTMPRPSFLPQNSAGQLSSADVNGDGYLDLMVSDDAQAVPGMIYLNDKHGMFTQGVSVPATARIIADLDGDHLAELIGGDKSNLLVWQGTGDPSYPAIPVKSASPGSLYELKILDMNQDGRLDIFSKNEKGGFLYFYALGNNAFEGRNVETYDDPFAFSDFNGDGKLDILSGSDLYYGNESGIFSHPGNVNDLAMYFPGSRYTADDFNKDGNIDLFFDASIYYGFGRLRFLRQGILSGGSNIAVTGDFNGDGNLDIVCGANNGYVTIFISDGKEGFLRSFMTTGLAANHIIQADFNNDSMPDIAVSGDNAASVILNNYSGSNGMAAFKGLNANAFMSIPGDSIPQTVQASGSARTVINKGPALAKIRPAAAKKTLLPQQKKTQPVGIQRNATSQPSLRVFPPRVGNAAVSVPAAADLAAMINKTATLKASPAQSFLLMRASRIPQEGQTGLWNLAREFQNYLKRHPVKADYALYADYAVNAKDWKQGYVRLILCNRKGELLIADMQNSGQPAYQNIRPTSMDGCNTLLVKRLMEYLR